MTKEEENKFYKKHGPDVHNDPVRFDTIAKLCQGKVLDIACGTGDLADYYKGDYIGIDVSDVAIGYAQKLRRKSAKFSATNFADLGFNAPIKLDTIVIAEFLEHLEEDELLFDNIKNLSHEKTRWIITVPNGDRVPDKDHKRIFTVPWLRKKFSVFGKVKFHNYPGFKERILLTVDLKKTIKDEISLVMPVKNEEKGLEKAILSCIDIVDNIVISVDNNSTDGTLKIAERYADTLKNHEWKNDFSAVRNSAQKDIKTKWILRLDGHEFVRKTTDLKKFFDKNLDGYFVKLFLESGFSFWFPAILKSRIKWKKAVHNFPDIKCWNKIKGFEIEHDRAGGQAQKAIDERTKQRDEMVIGIMTKKLKENKKDTRSAFYLAQQLSYGTHFKKSIKYYKQYLKYSKNIQERWLVWYELGNTYNFLNKPKKAIKYFERANKEMPKRWEIAKKIGGTYMMIKKWKKALPFLINSFDINKTDFFFNPEPRNNAQTWFFISQCFFALNEHEKAKIALKRAKKTQGESKFEKLRDDELKIIEELT